MLGISLGLSLGSNLGGAASAYWYTLGKADDTDPSFWADFANDRYAVNGAEEAFTDIFTFTRSTTGTYFDANGVMQSAAINAPRFDHDPLTGEKLGILIEEQRTNLVLNSSTGTNQSITTSATSYTLSFYGTGTVTLSGTYSGSLVGSGAYPDRSTLTFTATAGSLTISCSGTIQYIQIEAGEFATSYIPTTGSAVTRTEDLMGSSNSNTIPISSWLNEAEGCLFADYYYIGSKSTRNFVFEFDNGSYSGDRLQLANGNNVEYAVVVGGANQVSSITTWATASNTRFRHAGAYKANNFAAALDGTAVKTDTSGSPPTGYTRVNFGGNSLNGYLRDFRYYPIRVTNSELVRITT